MNVKQFKRRWLQSKIEPDLFYAPVKKEESYGKEMIFEITTTSNNTYVYISHTNYIDYIQSYGNFIGMLKNPKVLEHPGCKINVSSTGTVSITNVSDDFKIILEATDSKGNEVTPKSHPDFFIDWSYNSFETNQISNNMIMKNIGLKINWGDGIIDTFNDISWSKKTLDNGLTLKLYESLKNQPNHTYKAAGVYTVKITGNIPCIGIPNLCTKFLQWGNIGLRTLSNMFNYCTKLTDLTVLPDADSLNHVYAACDFTNGNIKNISYEILNYAPNLVLCNNTFPPCNRDLPDGYLQGKKYLTQCYGMFNKYIDYQIRNNLITEVNIGNDFMKDCKNLRMASYIFNNNPIKNIGDNFMSGCDNLFIINCGFNGCEYGFNHPDDNITYRYSIKTIGNNFLKSCSKLINVEYLFYNAQALLTIGEGMFSGCESIRNANYLFSQIKVLTKIPDKLFYDVKNNLDFVVDVFTFNYSFYKSYLSSPDYYTWETKEKFITEIGSNMFSDEFWSSGMKIHISNEIFCTRFTAYTNAVPDHYNHYINFNPYSGYYPNLWDHPESVYLKFQNSGKTEFLSVSDIKNGNYEIVNNRNPSFPRHLFGHDIGNYAFLGFNRYENLANNFNEIPKPIGYYSSTIYSFSNEEKKKILADEIWLEPMLYSYVRPNTIMTFGAKGNTLEKYAIYSISLLGIICSNGIVYNINQSPISAITKYDEGNISYLLQRGFGDGVWQTVSGVSLLYLRLTGFCILDTHYTPVNGIFYANFDGKSTRVSSGGIGSFKYYSLKVTENSSYLAEYLTGEADYSNIVTTKEYEGDNIINRTITFPSLANLSINVTGGSTGYYGMKNTGTVNFVTARQPISKTRYNSVNNFKMTFKNGTGTFQNGNVQPKILAHSNYGIKSLQYKMANKHNEYVTVSGESVDSYKYISGKKVDRWESPYMPTIGKASVESINTVDNNNEGLYLFNITYSVQGQNDAWVTEETPNVTWIHSKYLNTLSVSATGFCLGTPAFTINDFLTNWAINKFGEDNVTGKASTGFSVSDPSNPKKPVLNVSVFDDHITGFGSVTPPALKWLAELNITNGMNKEDFDSQYLTQ